ncbi:esterase [Rubrivivax gelatinosus]|nr:esterase [Rubrivivax gelatinosus]
MRTVRPLAAVVLIALLGTSSLQAWAQGERRGFFERRAASQDAAADDGGLAGEFGSGSCAERDRQVQRLMRSPLGARLQGPDPDLRDVAYGSKPRQRLDVFLPKGGNKPAPVIVMVHGGGWCVGDKNAAGVTRAKSAHWGRQGFVFVSVNYPMITDGSRALQQAADVARAVAFVQQHAADWGGDGQRVILVGHSAGAHLVSLVNADARLRKEHGVGPIVGVVSLDSGATNTVTQMQKAMPRMKARYEEAFGSSEDGWIHASPYHQLDRSAAPWLGVCSTRRADAPCEQARQYADKSNALGVKAAVLPVDKGHGAINKETGEAGAMTDEIDRFLGALDPALQARLARRP